MNIDWLQLIKNLASSKNVSLAFFITSLILVIGYNYDTKVPRVPEEVYVYVFTIMVFSGVLSLISLVSWAYLCLKDFVIGIFTKRSQENLSEIEKLIMLEFAPIGTGFVRIDQFQQYGEMYPKIAFANAFVSLEKKGLVKLQINGDACNVTNRGKEITTQLCEQLISNA